MKNFLVIDGKLTTKKRNIVRRVKRPIPKLENMWQRATDLIQIKFINKCQTWNISTTQFLKIHTHFYFKIERIHIFEIFRFAIGILLNFYFEHYSQTKMKIQCSSMRRVDNL